MSREKDDYVPETYYIPPNYVDSSGVFGGMFKLRNAIEACVLGLIIGAIVFNATGDMLTVGMFVALDYVWDKTKEDRTKQKAVFIDETWKLIGASSSSLAAEFVLEIFKVIRGYGGAAYTATQDIFDFFALEDGKYGKGIINNCGTKVVLGLEDDEAGRVQDILNLSESERHAITTFQRGEALISTGKNKVTVSIRASELEKELITTDRRELIAIVERKREQKLMQTFINNLEL